MVRNALERAKNRLRYLEMLRSCISRAIKESQILQYLRPQPMLEKGNLTNYAYYLVFLCQMTRRDTGIGNAAAIVRMHETQSFSATHRRSPPSHCFPEAIEVTISAGNRTKAKVGKSYSESLGASLRARCVRPIDPRTTWTHMDSRARSSK
jgi:hypothetical protein